MGWGSSVAVGCGVGHRHGSVPMLLWLWRRPATTALIGPPAWKPPCAMGTALKKGKKTKKKKKAYHLLKKKICAHTKKD